MILYLLDRLRSVFVHTLYKMILKGAKKMDQILAVVEQILAYFQEGDAAAVIDMIKGIDFTAIIEAIKGIIATITSLIG